MTISASSAPESSISHADSSQTLAEEPIFLVGSERSGTTLTRLMLDHHPQLAFFFEFEYAVHGISDDGAWTNVDEYIDYLENNLIFLASKLNIDRSLDYPQLVRSFLNQKKARDNKPFVGATVHYNFDRLQYVWPNARYIHLLRDGRDVARSIIEMGWAGNMYCAVERWIHAEHLWQKMCRTIPESRRIEVRYESLVTDPEATLTRICEWIGIPYDPAMLSYSERSTYKAPSTNSIGQWKRKLSEEEVGLAECRIGDMLKERGYSLSGYPLPEISPSREASLRRQNRVYCSNFRRKRYGNFLYAVDFCARRLKLHAVMKWANRKIREIESKHLK